jgi:Tfp pilus assembly protein PilX
MAHASSDDDDTGSILLLVLLALFPLILLSLISLQRASTNLKATLRFRDQWQTFQLAEAALDAAIHQLTSSPSGELHDNTPYLSVETPPGTRRIHAADRIGHR